MMSLIRKFANESVVRQTQQYQKWVTELRAELKTATLTEKQLKADVSVLAAKIKDMEARLASEALENQQLSNENKSLHNQVAIQEDVIYDLRKWQEIQLALKEKEIALHERARVKAQISLNLESDNENVP